MQITKEMVEFADSHNWDEDFKQDMYVKLLEQPDDYMEGVDFRKIMTTVYNNTLQDSKAKDSRRAELVQENVQAVEGLFTRGDNHDPFLHMEADELVKKAEGMSDLLRKTLQWYLAGVTVEQMAWRDSVSINTIYQRMHNIKQELHNGE